MITKDVSWSTFYGRWLQLRLLYDVICFLGSCLREQGSARITEDKDLIEENWVKPLD